CCSFPRQGVFQGGDQNRINLVRFVGQRGERVEHLRGDELVVGEGQIVDQDRDSAVEFGAGQDRGGGERQAEVARRLDRGVGLAGAACDLGVLVIDGGTEQRQHGRAVADEHLRRVLALVE